MNLFSFPTTHIILVIDSLKQKSWSTSIPIMQNEKKRQTGFLWPYIFVIFYIQNMGRVTSGVNYI